jgi:phage terminase large subunit-like protein
VLYHAQFLPNARVVVAGSSRQQAEWLYQAAAGFVDRSPEIRYRFKCQEGYRRIRYDAGGSRIQIFAADDRTGDGVIPTLAVLEELHRHRDLSLYRTWRGKLEKRGGQLVAISTAGEPEGDFEAVRKRMRDQATERSGRGSFLRAATETTVLHEYAVPEGRDPEHLPTVKKANPLKAITPAQLRRKLDSPAMTPSHWRRFVCGMPARLDSWVEPPAWDRLKVDIGGLEPGDQAVLALRVGAGCGIGIAVPRDDERVAVGIRTIAAPPSGRVPFREMEAALEELCEIYEVLEIGYDPKQIGTAWSVLEERGLPMVSIPQTPPRLASATATLWRLISGELLMHDGDAELRRQVLAGRTQETLGGWRLDPTPDTAALVALAMACHEACKGASPSPLIVVPRAG